MKKILIATGIEDTSRQDVRDVLRCKDAVEKALTRRGYAVGSLLLRDGDFRDDRGYVKHKILKNRPDCVFNLFEGFGDDPYKEVEFAEILEDAGLLFTGNSADTLRMCLDKHKLKNILRTNGITVPEGIVVRKAGDLAPAALKPPVFVKPCCEDGSVGIDGRSLVREGGRLKETVSRKLRCHPRGVVVEEFIPGREFNVGFTGKFPYELMGISMIDYGKYPDQMPFLSYGAKWDDRTEEYKRIVPLVNGCIEEDIRMEILKMSARVGVLLGCGGYFRIDLREKDGRVFVLDVNPNPDINVDSGFMKQAYSSGLAYEDVIERIVEGAVTDEWGRK